MHTNTFTTTLPTEQAASAAALAQKRPGRALRFKHVRVNRLCARVTFEGPPITVNDFGLVLDNRVYRNLEGGWKTVLNRWGRYRVWLELLIASPSCVLCS